MDGLWYIAGMETTGISRSTQSGSQKAYLTVQVCPERAGFILVEMTRTFANNMIEREKASCRATDHVLLSLLGLERQRLKRYQKCSVNLFYLQTRRKPFISAIRQGGKRRRWPKISHKTPFQCSLAKIYNSSIKKQKPS